MTWQPLNIFDLPDREEVDIWLNIPASPRSFGMADSFRVIDAYQIDGNWFHRGDDGKEKELYRPYITHWMLRPAAPSLS